MANTRSRLARLIFDNSLLLLAGTIAAVAWANLDLVSYDRIAHPLHFWVNDVGMVFFFALAAKEVFEATLHGGPLASPPQAMAPLAAAVGGMVAPALVYVALTSIGGRRPSECRSPVRASRTGHVLRAGCTALGQADRHLAVFWRRSTSGREPAPGTPSRRDLVVIGITAAIGFTVSLFFATAAFPPGAALAETKMGALLSFSAAPLALIASQLLKGRSARGVDGVARG